MSGFEKQLAAFLENETNISAVELVDSDSEKLIFFGWDEEDGEVQVKVNNFNQVFIDGEITDVYLPFNVWSEIGE